jgi:hypothetical protein
LSSETDFLFIASVEEIIYLYLFFAKEYKRTPRMAILDPTIP